MKKLPKTNQSSRKSKISVPSTAASQTRPKNFWANAAFNSSSPLLNLFINNSHQKPLSSIFLTSKPSSSTPEKSSFIRKFSDPRLSIQKEENLSSSRTDYYNKDPLNENFMKIIRKESPLTFRNTNSSQFYRKIKKPTENSEKILSRKLILDRRESFDLIEKGLKKEISDAYGLPENFLLKKSYKQNLLSDKNDKNKTTFVIKNKVPGVEHRKIQSNPLEANKISEISQPKTNIVTIQKSSNEKIDSLFEEDLFAKHHGIKRKFKMKTFLSPRDEFLMKKTENSNREIKKKLIVPRIYENDNAIKKRTLLVIENVYLNECKNAKSLKYCYLEIPYKENTEVLPSHIISMEFMEITRVLKEKFNMNSKELFIFLKNGEEIKSHYDIPITERTLIVTGSPIFLGLETKNQLQSFVLKKIIYRLERPLLNEEHPNRVPMSIEKNIEKKYSDVIQDLLNMLSKDPHDSLFLENLVRRRSSIPTSRKEGVYPLSERGNSRLTYRNKEEYFDANNNDRPLIHSKKFEDICKICDIYNRNNDEIVFDKFEKDDEDENDENMLKELEDMKRLSENGNFKK